MPLVTRLGLFAFIVLFAIAAEAQPAGGCPSAARQPPPAYLDAAGVRASLYNRGQLFFNGGDPLYEVPKGSGIHAHFAAGIWIGGLVEGELRTAAATYAQGSEDYEYFPGPLDADGRPPDDCTPYDRIWTVSLSDVAFYDQTGVATRDLREWPGHLGAPFFDVDRDGAYRLEAGDRPKVYGTQTAWWVMNDAGGPHRTTLSPPIGLELRVTAFAAASPVAALYYATFYRYEITYRGSAPIDSTYFALWNDPDLGNYGDDYIGSDPAHDLGFVYNSDNNDEVGSGGYGLNPPALGFRFLETPEDRGLTVARYYNSSTDPRTSNPDTDQDYYYYMQGLWRDGSAMTFGGNGTNPNGEPTTLVYPHSGTWDEPRPRFWSEVCPTSNCSTPIPPDDRRLVVSTGPFRMEPGQTEVVTVALVWARGSDNFRSLQKMKVASDYVARAYALGVLDPTPPALSEEPEPGPEALAFVVAPSPFRDVATVRLAVPEGARAVRVAVYDVLGREVAVLLDGRAEAGEHALALDGRALPAGVYVVRLETERQAQSVVVTHVE